LNEDRELVITRVFDAPRELVFHAWTDPKHIGQWWGPKGFSTTTYEIDVRPGGVWRFMMHGPDGVNYPNRIVYNEIAAPERLVYTHGGDAMDEPFHVTVTFAEQGGKTKLTMRTLFASAADRDKVVKESGAIEGANQTLDRLAEQLARQLFITRVFDAPRELVFETWTDCKHASWWGPKDFTTTACTIDLRPGGEWRSCMRSPEGLDYWSHGVYREIVPPERLVFTFAWDDAHGQPTTETLVTVILAARGGKTKMTFHQTPFDSVEQRDAHEEGWSQSFERLAAYVVER
jgi:uncharacterized protein YndB with AHSA1/START domain